MHQSSTQLWPRKAVRVQHARALFVHVHTRARMRATHTHTHTHARTQEVGSEPSLRALASDAFRSFVRAYATHSTETKKAFHVRNLHLVSVCWVC